MAEARATAACGRGRTPRGSRGSAIYHCRRETQAHVADVETTSLGSGLLRDETSSLAARRSTDALALEGRLVGETGRLGVALSQDDAFAVGAGRDVEDAVVGQTRVLERVEVPQVALLGREDGGVAARAGERVALAGQQPEEVGRGNVSVGPVRVGMSSSQLYCSSGECVIAERLGRC